MAMSKMGVLIDGETIFIDMQFLFDSFKFNVFGRDNGDGDDDDGVAHTMFGTLCLYKESMLGDNLLWLGVDMHDCSSLAKGHEPSVFNVPPFKFNDLLMVKLDVDVFMSNWRTSFDMIELDVIE